MKVTFPHMGNVEIIMKDLLERLEVEYVVPPRTTNKTISLGSSLSPELACFPLKVTLGNMAEGIEAGADTIIMAGGFGPCRFGYYAQVQQEVLRQAGYKFEMVVVEPPSVGIGKFISPFKKLAPGKSYRSIWNCITTSFNKARQIDLIEKKANQLKPYEAKSGEVRKTLGYALKLLEEAQTKKQIDNAAKQAREAFNQLETIDRDVLKIGILGEFYILLDPFINFDLEDYLAKKGVETERSVYLTDWISPSSKNIVSGHCSKEVESNAERYLSHWVGGEGQATIGHALIFSQKKFDGLIHLFPFTCMPEIIAQSILPKLSRDLDIPYLTLIFDEQTGRSGVVTRLEAFLDLLISKKKSNKQIAGSRR
jgi:predicted nucleotide-binding protein (sugar kinase/HSP70/actin superfamily)